MTNVPLLDEVVAAHGGAERWARVRRLELQVRIGGNILALRFKSPRNRSLEVTVDTRRVHVSLDPFPRRGMRGIFFVTVHEARTTAKLTKNLTA